MGKLGNYGIKISANRDEVRIFVYGWDKTRCKKCVKDLEKMMSDIERQVKKSTAQPTAQKAPHDPKGPTHPGSCSVVPKGAPRENDWSGWKKIFELEGKKKTVKISVKRDEQKMFNCATDKINGEKCVETRIYKKLSFSRLRATTLGDKEEGDKRFGFP